MKNGPFLSTFSNNNLVGIATGLEENGDIEDTAGL